MGKTSVKTAWSPRFLRRDWGNSAWRNSTYELVCNSMRLGGAMISLIFPKLILLSVARDGIYYSRIGRARPQTRTAKPLFSFNDTKQAPRFSGNLPKPNLYCRN